MHSGDRNHHATESIKQKKHISETERESKALQSAILSSQCLALKINTRDSKQKED